MSSCLTLFHALRVAQVRMIVLMIIHGLRSNARPEGNLGRLCQLVTPVGLFIGASCSFHEGLPSAQCGYIRFTHIVNTQPKFYVGSATHGTMDREHGRTSWTCTTFLAWSPKSLDLGSNPSFCSFSRLQVPRAGVDPGMANLDWITLSRANFPTVSNPDWNYGKLSMRWVPRTSRYSRRVCFKQCISYQEGIYGCDVPGPPSMDKTKWTSFHPKQDILALTAEPWTQHCQSLSTHITKSTISALGTSFEGAVFHCEDKQTSSLRFSVRASTTSPWRTLSLTTWSLNPWTRHPLPWWIKWFHRWNAPMGKATHGLLGLVVNCPPATSWPRRRNSTAGRAISSFVDSPFRPMLNVLARMIFQLIPVGRPNHLAVGDVCTLLKLLKEAPEHDDLRIFNQDLAGFFISIEQDRFLGSWYMLLDSFDPTWTWTTTKFFPFVQGRLTIQVILWKVELSSGSTLLGRLQYIMFQTSSKMPWTCNPLLLVLEIFGKDVVALWAALCHQHFVSWWYPSANKSGPSTFKRLWHTITFLFGTFAMWTTD